MIINKEYALVDAKVRTHINLHDYEKEIRQAAEIIFIEDLKDVRVKQFSFTISIDSPTEKIKHGLLVNFGKCIARQVSGLCASAMKIYPNIKHKPSRQLFKCISNTYHTDD
ncbi:MAG: hypothetical protein ACK5M5_13350 [Limnobaculum xujianqingii]